jgi:hypothetical protein
MIWNAGYIWTILSAWSKFCVHSIWKPSEWKCLGWMGCKCCLGLWRQLILTRSLVLKRCFHMIWSWHSKCSDFLILALERRLGRLLEQEFVKSRRRAKNVSLNQLSLTTFMWAQNVSNQGDELCTRKMRKEWLSVHVFLINHFYAAVSCHVTSVFHFILHIYVIPA